jgi:CxxC motif-containing protein (DUF1111 family)
MTGTCQGNKHAFARVVVIAALLHLTTNLESNVALSQTPDYEGTICRLDENTVRYEVLTDPDVQNILLYAEPPGGGWYLDLIEPGRFRRNMNSPIGQEIRFHLLLQNPMQFSFPDHIMNVDDGCDSFQRDDVTPPPVRGFRHEFILEKGEARITFEANPGNYLIPETASVDLRYRVDGNEITTTRMATTDQRFFETVIPNIGTGTEVIYWFKQQVGEQPVDSTLFTRIAGQTPPPALEFPIQSRFAGRFRDRHPNEWRFDHYVANYAGGKTFEMVVTDHGDSLEMTVVADEYSGPERVDFKYYIQSNPGEMCDRPITAVNLMMAQNSAESHVFTSSIPDITPGQIIEFDFTHVGVPDGEGGVIQYYTEYFYYHTGTGKLGLAQSNPRASAAGDASIPLVSSPRFAFAQHANNLTIEELNRFLSGKERFETDHVDGLLKNFPTWFDCCSGPIGFGLRASSHARPEALGPMLNASSCIACHHLDGRGATPTGEEDTLTSLVMQLSMDETDAFGAPIPDPRYGRQFDTASAEGYQPEGRLQVDYEIIDGTFDDGTPYQLRRPSYRFEDTLHGVPMNARQSARIAPMLAGTGLLEALMASEILSHEDPDDADGDGVSGRANWVRDVFTDEITLGRFGWKASQPGLVQQTAIAYQRDMGITSEYLPSHDCGSESEDCPPNAPPELGTVEIELVAEYVAGLAPPPRLNHEDPMAIIGMQLFKNANCQACHIPSMRTRTDHETIAYRDQRVEAFTDLLLHDMGPGLADDFEVYQASGSEWRTPPLWGAGYVGHVLGVPDECTDPFSGEQNPNYLHDGRARTLMEAVLWHGGEASESRAIVLGMNADEREALLRYIAYPFDDPSLHDEDTKNCSGDLNNDGMINGGDLTVLLTAWGRTGPGDLDGNAIVDGADLTELLNRWGSCE